MHFTTILPYLINICSGIILAIATYVINTNGKRRDEDKERQEERTKALSDGVQALLRESIVSNYNKYSDKGFCPIYAKESTKRVYKAYEKLGGNDVATELYQKLIHMPEEPEVSYHE